MGASSSEVWVKNTLDVAMRLATSNSLSRILWQLCKTNLGKSLEKAILPRKLGVFWIQSGCWCQWMKVFVLFAYLPAALLIHLFCFSFFSTYYLFDVPRTANSLDLKAQLSSMTLEMCQPRSRWRPTSSLGSRGRSMAIEVSETTEHPGFPCGGGGWGTAGCVLGFHLGKTYPILQYNLLLSFYLENGIKPSNLITILVSPWRRLAPLVLHYNWITVVVVKVLV